MKKAIIPVTYELLHSVLQLPHDLKITDVSSYSGGWREAVFFIKVRDPENYILPDFCNVANGEVIPQLAPSARENDDGTITWDFGDS